MTDRFLGKVDKGWGYEIIWANHEDYCGKFLVFEKEGSKFSMHFHKNKTETWFVNQGQFRLLYCDTETAEYKEKILQMGETWTNTPLVPHQLEALSPGATIIEVSSADEPEDNYRIIPGDSQKKDNTAEPNADADNQ